MSIELTVLIAVIGIILSIATFFSGRYASQTKKGHEEGSIEAKLDAVGRDVRDIKEDLTAIRQEQGDLRDRITTLETIIKMSEKVQR